MEHLFEDEEQDAPKIVRKGSQLTLEEYPSYMKPTKAYEALTKEPEETVAVKRKTSLADSVSTDALLVMSVPVEIVYS